MGEEVEASGVRKRRGKTWNGRCVSFACIWSRPDTPSRHSGSFSISSQDHVVLGTGFLHSTAVRCWTRSWWLECKNSTSEEIIPLPMRLFLLYSATARPPMYATFIAFGVISRSCHCRNVLFNLKSRAWRSRSFHLEYLKAKSGEFIILRYMASIRA